MLELVLAILGGMSIGILTGLLPGIHINLVMTLALPFLTLQSSISAFALAAGITALAATHTILDFIPSIYVGAPEAETALSLLPAHQLLLQGKGHEAVLIVLGGALSGLAALILTSPLFIYLSPKIDTLPEILIPFTLIGIVLFMMLREEKPLQALVCFMAAGFLGYAALNLPIEEPLFPLLGGLFGMSGLLLALKNQTPIPVQQKITWRQMEITKKDSLKTLRDVALIGFPCSILPALGSGYASLIVSELRKLTSRQFLMMASAMSLYTMGASLCIIYALGKARTGAAAGIRQALTTITTNDLFILLGIFGIVALSASAIAIPLSKGCARIINKIEYSKISFIVAIAIAGAVMALSGMKGILVLATGAAIGIYAQHSGLKRMHLMGCLIVPTIFYYLG